MSVGRVHEHAIQTELRIPAIQGWKVVVVQIKGKFVLRCEGKVGMKTDWGGLCRTRIASQMMNCS